MSITYNADGSQTNHIVTRPLWVLIWANVALAAAHLFYWSLMAIVVEEPVAWATWMPVRHGSTLRELLQYPFVMLWLMPLFAALSAYFSGKAGKREFGVMTAAVPPTMLGLIVGVYYGFPQFH